MPDAADEAAEVSTSSSPGARLYFDLARRQLDEQAARIDSLDRKLASTFVLSGALIALLAAGFSFRQGEPSIAVWSLLIAVVLAFMANLLFAALAFQIRTWLDFPPLDNYEELASKYNDTMLLIWLARGMREAFLENEIHLSRKVTWVRLSTTATMTNLGLAALTLVISTWPF